MAVRLSAPRAGRPLPPGRFLVLISVRGWVGPRAIVLLEGLGQLKNLVTSSGIKLTYSLAVRSSENLRLLYTWYPIFLSSGIHHWMDFLQYNSGVRLLAPLPTPTYRTRDNLLSGPYPSTCLAWVILPVAYAPASIDLQMTSAGGCPRHAKAVAQREECLT
jgi:hypothetical protein